MDAASLAEPVGSEAHTDPGCVRHAMSHKPLRRYGPTGPASTSAAPTVTLNHLAHPGMLSTLRVLLIDGVPPCTFDLPVGLALPRPL
jgi:hypothetical protein